MTKTYTVAGVDCPICAEKVCAQVQRIEGIENAKINFTQGRLTIDAEAADERTLLKKITKAARRVEPDFEISK